MAKILVIRLAAIADVAMTLPVIYSAAKANPQDSFTVLTQAFMMPVFMNRPFNLEVIGISTKGAEKTLIGLLRFTSALVKFDYDIVLDLQDVIRTWIICAAFRLKGKPVYVLDKIRKKYPPLMRRENKKLKPLPTVIERYADVFRAAGLAYTESFTSLYESRPADLSKMEAIAGVKTGKWLGVAPFARYQGKVYPIDEMEQVVATLSKREDLTLFLFGAKGYEEAVLEDWAYRYPRVKNVVGKYTLDNELALISQLDLLLSMDSANMHFASLVGTRVLSVWGATHIYTGFYGYRQRPEDVIGLPLPCRPCSQFGQKECSRGDWACLTQLPAEKIVSRVQAVLEEQSGCKYRFRE